MVAVIWALGVLLALSAPWTTSSLAFFFGLSAGSIGKIKGSSFLIWFLVGLVLPLLGTLAAIL